MCHAHHGQQGQQWDKRSLDTHSCALGTLPRLHTQVRTHTFVCACVCVCVSQAMEEAGLSVVDFVDVGIECTLRQLLEYGYFHADPHPGE